MRTRWPWLLVGLLAMWLLPQGALLRGEQPPLKGAIIVVDPGQGGQG
jgi:hypothetical protein